MVWTEIFISNLKFLKTERDVHLPKVNGRGLEKGAQIQDVDLQVKCSFHNIRLLLIHIPSFYKVGRS